MRRLAILIAVVIGTSTLCAQGGLSNQVLQLLSRNNNWSGSNSFSNLVVPIATVPSSTTARIYTDLAGNLYYNGGLIAGAGGGVTPHNLLSTTHSDTLAASVVRGDVIVGNATPAWSRLAKCTSGYFLGANGTDTVCSNDATAFINLPAANLTGTLAAVSGINLTNLNASNLASGTVPLARLSGITNTQIDAAAGISYTKLNLAASVNLASDMTGVLPLANGGTGVSTAANHTTLVSNGSIWTTATIPDCHAGTTALGFTQASNVFNCQAISVGSGTVTSVGLSLPAIFTVSGSPITGSGTLTAVLASQTQNLVLASPNGSSGAPTMRALAAADIPSLAGSIITSGIFAPSNGSAGAPVYAFAAQPALGFYRFGASQIGVTGSLVASTDASFDLGATATTQRFRNGFFTGILAGAKLQVGAGAVSVNNITLRTTVNGMLDVALGDESAYADLRVNRSTLGSGGDATFATGVNSVWNLIHTWTGDMTTRQTNIHDLQVTFTPAGTATQFGVGGRYYTNATGAQNFTAGMEALVAKADFHGAGTVAALYGADLESAPSTGIVTTNYGTYLFGGGTGTSSVTTNYTGFVDTPTKGTALTNHYGWYVNDQTLAGTTIDEALHYEAPSSKQFRVLANGEVVIGGATPGTQLAGALHSPGILQANLGTPTNGTMIFCTDCTTASACTGGGTGALAVRQNGSWKCL